MRVTNVLEDMRWWPAAALCCTVRLWLSSRGGTSRVAGCIQHGRRAYWTFGAYPARCWDAWVWRQERAPHSL